MFHASVDCGPQGPLAVDSRTWGSRETECEEALILEASPAQELVYLEVWGGTWQQGEPRVGPQWPQARFTSYHPLQAPCF